MANTYVLTVRYLMFSRASGVKEGIGIDGAGFGGLGEA
jgi:hypothetical protein